MHVYVPKKVYLCQYIVEVRKKRRLLTYKPSLHLQIIFVFIYRAQLHVLKTR